MCEKVSLEALMCLKPALNPMRVLRSRARVETEVDMWDEIENCEKESERRRVAKNRVVAANFPPKFGGPS